MSAEPTRESLRVPVRLDVIGDVEIAAWLSVPVGANHDVLQLLVHGATYNHLYWDFPHRPEIYSYVRWAEGKGIATLAIDQLGAGASSHPVGDLTTNAANAEALHRVVQFVRTNGIAGQRFRRIVLVGHSAGSLASALEAVTYHDVDAVVLTGVIGPANDIANNDPRLVEYFHSTADDPVVNSVRNPDGYMTTRPGKRGPMFYRTPPADPSLIVVDETLKDVATTGQLASFGDANQACNKIECPTFVIQGQYDALHYDQSGEEDTGPVIERARAAAPNNYTFGPAVPNMGHNLNLHPGAHQVYEDIAAWIATTLPPD